jgi:hypothetical protein
MTNLQVPAVALMPGDVIPADEVHGWKWSIEVTGPVEAYPDPVTQGPHGPRVAFLGVAEGRLVRVVIAPDLLVRVVRP